MMITPNSIVEGDGFYVSYNPVDVAVYGDVTTALVVGQMEQFYVLNGDHRDGYAPLIPDGLQACLKYFADHSDQINKHSQKMPI